MTLAAIYERDGRVTLDAVADELGQRRMTVYHHLRKLWTLELIELGPGQTRPLVQPVALSR